MGMVTNNALESINRLSYMALGNKAFGHTPLTRNVSSTMPIAGVRVCCPHRHRGQKG